MYVYYNPNPRNKRVGDCVVRALCKLLNQDWHTVFMTLCLYGDDAGDMPSSNSVWSSYLKGLGFRQYLIPDTCPNCYTVKDFCMDHPNGLYLLATGSHVIAVENGDYYDISDTGYEVPTSYFMR